jgi:hypothetical protein
MAREPDRPGPDGPEPDGPEARVPARGLIDG